MIMINDKISEIILCSGIKMDKNYENVLSYSDSQLVTLCRNKAIYTGTNYAIINDTTIRVACKYEDAIYANYIAYINPRYGNKWFFGWVTNVKLLNPNTTEITYQKDVYSTWNERFIVNQAFIEREHTDDDTIGKNTVPESLETGDYIINEVVELGTTELNTKYIAMAYSGNPQSTFPSYGAGKTYTGLYTGYNYMILGSSQDAEALIQGFADNGALEMIYCLFTIPRGLIKQTTLHWYNGPGATGSDVLEVGDGRYPMMALVPNDAVGALNEMTILSDTNVNINTSLNTYNPVNNKLFTGKYNFLYITNNTGQDLVMNYEDFINNQPIFKITGAISIGCCVKVIPENYKKYQTSSDNSLYVYGINGAKYPTLGWAGDAYTNWLTQNAINLGVSFATSGMSVLGGAFSGNVAATVGGLASIATTLQEVYKHSMVSETGQGNLNSGDLTFSSKKMNFTIYKMSIKKEAAMIIDRYFSRFGYQTNLVKQPNLKSRLKFNFIKVGGMDELISGNIPAQDLEELNNIFRKGVTIFHDYDAIGNYTISNPIRTP